MVQIHIVGLPDSYRGDRLEAQLSKIGLDFKRRDGVTDTFQGRDSKEFVDQNGARTVYGRSLTAGEIGCALAHYSIYSDATVSEEWTMVLEDDAVLVDPEALDDFLNDLPKLYFRQPTIFMLFARQALRSKKNTFQIGATVYSRSKIIPSSTVAYVCNSAARQLLTTLSLPLISPADWPYRTADKIDFFLPDELLVTIQDEDSEVGTREKVPVSQQLLLLGSHLSGREWLKSKKLFPTFQTYSARFHTWIVSRALLLLGGFKSETLPKIPAGLIDLIRLNRRNR